MPAQTLNRVAAPPDSHAMGDAPLPAGAASAGQRRRYPLSEKRLAANRANARRSTGPRTPRGKQRARLNAVRHGLRATLLAEQTPEVAAALGEDSREFWSLYTAFVGDLCPRNDVERQLVERAARAAWRLRRTDAMEVELIKRAAAEGGGTRTGPLTIGAAIAQQFRASRGSAFLRLADYQSRLESSFHRALRELCRIRKQQAKRRGSAAAAKLGIRSTLAGLGHLAGQDEPRTNEPIVREGEGAPEIVRSASADGSTGVERRTPTDQQTPRTNEPIEDPAPSSQQPEVHEAVTTQKRVELP